MAHAPAGVTRSAARPQGVHGVGRMAPANNAAPRPAARRSGARSPQPAPQHVTLHSAGPALGRGEREVGASGRRRATHRGGHVPGSATPAGAGRGRGTPGQCARARRVAGTRGKSSSSEPTTHREGVRGRVATPGRSRTRRLPAAPARTGPRQPRGRWSSARARPPARGRFAGCTGRYHPAGDDLCSFGRAAGLRVLAASPLRPRQRDARRPRRRARPRRGRWRCARRLTRPTPRRDAGRRRPRRTSSARPPAPARTARLRPLRPRPLCP